MIRTKCAMGVWRYICALVAWLCLLLPGQATALEGYDLRLASAVASAGRNEAILHVSDCSSVVSVTLDAGAMSDTLSIQQAAREDNGTTAYQFSLLIDNAEILDISASIEQGDGSSTRYSRGNDISTRKSATT